MTIKVGDEWVIEQLICKCVDRYEVNGYWVVVFLHQETKTMFRRNEALLEKPRKSLKLAEGGNN